MDARQTDQAPQTIQLSDYRPPAWVIEHVALTFELEASSTRVLSTLKLSPNPEAQPGQPIRLDGEALELLSISRDGVALSEADYVRDEDSLTLEANGPTVLHIETAINPAANTRLEGLYVSSGNFCTQCEAEGFRRITYFPDRPDVMTRFTVTMRADKTAYPVLLSNGNLVSQQDLDGGRHEAVWDDPHPKPSYLFALVAGALDCLVDSFTTQSGRTVALRIFVEKGETPRAAYAMDALKRSMKWDEDTYGREYDLDLFNIVAVSDFNMGAMENKSLNVFNAKFILADPETATDMDYAFIESVVAHEYFHNWSGNRVTCRDWFQLSLKEGFTVFRDQHFSADMRSAPVQRIQDVRQLRARQFPEDAGPLAHPVRPESYIEINNFYTATVYEKGAEVVRMLQRLVGTAGFREGSDLYFDRHDGQAVTCEHFVRAMEDATGRDLGHFMRWYSQAGTPHVTYTGTYDERAQRYVLSVRQETSPTPGEPAKDPLVIPLGLGLVGPDGRDLEGVSPDPAAQILQSAEQTITFDNVPTRPVLSVNRGFAAPVIVHRELGDDDAAHLMAFDPDPFARFEAAQSFATRLVLGWVSALQAGRGLEPADRFIEAFGTVLKDEGLDPAFKAELLSLPSEDYLADQMATVDVDRIHMARERLMQALAQEHRDALMATYHGLQSNAPFSPDAQSAGERALKNTALMLLARLESDREAAPLPHTAFDGATNMTDRMAALHALNLQSNESARAEALDSFYQRFEKNPHVIDKWFVVQAVRPHAETLSAVEALLDHPAFSMKNPNKVRSLIGAYASSNPVGFHRADGAGYRFLADRILALDAINPQIAARLVAPLGQWRRFDAARASAMKDALDAILTAQGSRSKDVYEMASKARSA